MRGLDKVDERLSKPEVSPKRGFQMKKISLFTSAAINAELIDKNKSRAGTLYYRGALNRDVYHLRSGLSNSCQSTKEYYQKACGFGEDEACRVDCLKK
ncbi:MAG: hypothetical protein ACAI44_32955 [Candidatus Sericytochromatia bacterium]